VLRPPAKMGRREFTKREKYLMGLTKSELVGTYRLLYGGIQWDDGTIEYPYGEGAVGHLVYLDNDRVSWHIVAADRPSFSNPDLLGESPEENDEAFRTSNGYFGTYTIEGGLIRYDIEVAQVLNMVGPGHSHARLEGDELRLTSKRMRIGGHEGHTKFVWKRVGS
jgi:lipocalin-like protein